MIANGYRRLLVVAQCVQAVVTGPGICDSAALGFNVPASKRVHAFRFIKNRIAPESDLFCFSL
jgi:hypothetical protein